jgi:hypothetical protein
MRDPYAASLCLIGHIEPTLLMVLVLDKSPLQREEVLDEGS